MDAALPAFDLAQDALAAFHAASGCIATVQTTPSVETGVCRCKDNGIPWHDEPECPLYSIQDVAVLFVAKDSIYKTLGCDCYDAERNALTYDGTAPVVTHPPCQLWGKMAKINYQRWGGEHNKPGNDGGCFRFALDAVNRCGGVLEHPAETYAWMTHGLPYPPGIGWTHWKQGWVCEVWQSAYGHRAQKRTWLYYCGAKPPHALRWDRPAGTHQVGFHDQRGKAANKPTLSKREANATPKEFAHALISLAAMATTPPTEKQYNESR